MSDSKPTDGVTAPETDAAATAPEATSEHTSDVAGENVATESIAAERPTAPAVTSPVEDTTDSTFSSANETKAYDTSALVAAAFEAPAAAEPPATPETSAAPETPAAAEPPVISEVPAVRNTDSAESVAAPAGSAEAPVAAETELPEPVAAERVKRETYIPAAVVGGVAAGAATVAAADAPVAYVPGAPYEDAVAPAPSAAPSAAPAAAYGAAAAAPVAPTPIYVQAPTPPTPAGNRAGGILIALIATVAYAILFAIAAFVISGVTSVTVAQAITTFSEFVVRPVFFIPVIFFFIAFSLLIAIVNRGGWWAYVVFGFLVAVIVYFSYIGGALLTVQAWTMTPTEAAHFIGTQWLNPGAIAAAVIAREVPIWFGAWIAARGRKVTARNIEARQEYDRLIDEGPQLTSPF
ncbi:hypothetical protein AB4Y63_10490 [Leifsonia sp. YAF41]|uniref:hypothetical protein n=1 Tax=Leifsonia sp. YAF41 TaxID=3233086 RepID=UPI003F9B1292